MTKQLDRLAAAGHVTRIPNPDDRRSNIVQLTDRGRRLIDVALEDHLQAETTLVDGIDSTKTELFIEMLWDASRPPTELGPRLNGNEQRLRQ